jgi:hypothetical protein
MSRLAVPSLARTGWVVLTSPRRFHATLAAEEGIARAVLFFFACATLASALDLVGIAVARGTGAALGALPITLVRLVLVVGLVPFIGGGILYGVCWIAGSKAFIETGIHVVAYAIGTVLPLAAVLRHHPTHGQHSAGAALLYGLVLVVVGARLTWDGRPAEPSVAGIPRPQPSP